MKAKNFAIFSKNIINKKIKKVLHKKHLFVDSLQKIFI